MPSHHPGAPPAEWPHTLPSMYYACCSVTSSIEVLHTICIGVLWLLKQRTTNGGLKQQKCILSQIWGPDQVQNQGVSWAVLLPKLLGAESLVSSCRFWWLHVFPGLGLPHSGLCLFPPPSCASLCVPGIRTPLLDLGPIWMIQDDLISRF